MEYVLVWTEINRGRMTCIIQFAAELPVTSLLLRSLLYQATSMTESVFFFPCALCKIASSHTVRVQQW